ncbi:MAG: ATP-binding cassette domain-containing protein [Candidatus Marinimicrobia bacterium]|nr:ATP-binding cassette domain-containing protein [Candidatus Neomarinimicrobiota bacterium]MDD5582897.1 ATP-binding cassette domain-containing protein [Candidatus Neomarinimicrobiota bacterium]
MSDQTPVIELQDLNTKRGIQKLEIYSMKIYPGVCYHIYGPNGSGKSLLMDVLAHQQSVEKGNVFFENKSQKKKEYSISVARNQIAYFQQKPKGWIRGTVLSYLKETLKKRNISEGIAYQQVMTQLDEFNLKDFANIKRRHLSPGVFQKVELMRCLLQSSKVIILDEPYGILDEDFIKKFNKRLRSIINNEKKAVVIASAQSLSRFRIVDIVLSMNHGRIVRVEKTQSPQKPESRSKSRHYPNKK